MLKNKILFHYYIYYYQELLNKIYLYNTSTFFVPIKKITFLKILKYIVKLFIYICFFLFI